METQRFQSFSEFYPYYLTEHSNRNCRRLHFIGSTGSLLAVGTSLVLQEPMWLLAALFCGYGFAWVGHFFFEHNRPATFRHPIYSFMGDWVMYRDMWRGRVTF